MQGQLELPEKQIKRYLSYLLLLLPLLIFRDFTLNNELKYLSIADEALRDSHFFTFYNHGTIYADKPPLYLWLVMLCRTLFGGHFMLPLSLLSALPAIGIIEVMRRWTGKQGAEYELVTLTGVYFIAAAAVVRMDMLLSFFIILALRSFWKIRTERHFNWGLPLFTFLALFTKGPVGVMLPLLASIVFLSIKGELRDFGLYWGWRSWALMLSLFSIWMAGVWFEGGPEYINELLVHQTVGRAVNAFTHKEPFFYYLYTILYAFLPWVPLVLFLCFKERKSRTEQECFLICASVSYIALMSCFSSKLQIYLLPVWPLLVYSCRGLEGRRWVRAAGRGVLTAACALGLACPLINDLYGARSLCRDASNFAQAHAASGYAAYRLRSAANMDVWLGEPVHELSSFDSASLSGNVIFLKTGDLQRNSLLRSLFYSSDHHEGRTYSFFIVDSLKEQR